MLKAKPLMKAVEVWLCLQKPNDDDASEESKGEKSRGKCYRQEEAVVLKVRLYLTAVTIKTQELRL